MSCAPSYGSYRSCRHIRTKPKPRLSSEARLFLERFPPPVSVQSLEAYRSVHSNARRTRLADCPMLPDYYGTLVRCSKPGRVFTATLRTGKPYRVFRHRETLRLWYTGESLAAGVSREENSRPWVRKRRTPDTSPRSVRARNFSAHEFKLPIA